MTRAMLEIDSSQQHINGISPDHPLRGYLYRSALKLKAPGVLSKLAFLKAQEYLSPEEALSSQENHLKSLLIHAAANVPYYRDILPRLGIINTFGDIHLDQFQNIPLLDKATLHSKFDKLTSDDLDQRKWFKVSSGGSTGEMTLVIQDQEFADWARAVGLFFDGWAGFSLGDPKLIVWAISRDSRGKCLLLPAPLPIYLVRLSRLAGGRRRLDGCAVAHVACLWDSLPL